VPRAAFNSLSRDHAIGLQAISLVPSLIFQLPLSGSLVVQLREHEICVDCAFNSLSRDHIEDFNREFVKGQLEAVFQLPLSGSLDAIGGYNYLKEYVLSTPSLGITKTV